MRAQVLARGEIQDLVEIGVVDFLEYVPERPLQQVEIDHHPVQHGALDVDLDGIRVSVRHTALRVPRKQVHAVEMFDDPNLHLIKGNRETP